MTRKVKFDSVAGQLEIENHKKNKIEPPAYLDKMKPVERRLWDGYILARTEWRESDLITLRDVVYLDAEISRIKKTLANADDLEFSGQGSPLANPMHAILDKKMSARLATLRSLSLNTATQTGVALNTSGIRVKGTPEKTPAKRGRPKGKAAKSAGPRVPAGAGLSLIS